MAEFYSLKNLLADFSYSSVADILSSFIFIFTSINSSVAVATSRNIYSQHEADFPLGYVPEMILLE